MNHHCLFRLTVLPLAAALSLALPAQASDDRVPKPSAKPAAKPAAPTTRHKPEGVAPKADADAEVDPLERVRERLAERLGAAKPANAGSHVVQIAARAPAAPLPDPTRHGDTKPAAKSNDKSAKSAPSHGKAADGHDLHWAYKGDVVGPQAWGGLRPEFALCGTGKRQSPIDIRDGIAVDLEPVQFDYRASGFRVIDNGHTVQVNLAPGNFIGVGGRRWELVQFHFHRPSEERIDGRQFDMVAHLVHKDDEGRLAVVAVLLERGSAQPIVQTIWNNLPLEKNEEFAASVVIDLNHLLPPDRRYFTYMGSLTTPPCSEGVTWIVMRQPVQLSQQQIDIFGRLYPMNARPVQQASGRLIKQSQ